MLISPHSDRHPQSPQTYKMFACRLLWKNTGNLLGPQAHDLGIGNGGGKQGRGNQPPYQRYGPDTEIQYRPLASTRTCKTQQNSLQKGSRYGISVSTPHRRYGHDCGRRFCGRHFRDFYVNSENPPFLKRVREDRFTKFVGCGDRGLNLMGYCLLCPQPESLYATQCHSLASMQTYGQASMPQKCRARLWGRAALLWPWLGRSADEGRRRSSYACDIWRKTLSLRGNTMRGNRTESL